jgi:tetratricopeptide (TPR) repeat protein
MSNEAKEEVDKNVCAICGVVGVDNIKLEGDGGCDLVKYCCDECRELHRQQHSEECNKCAVKLHDKRLFTQPDGTHLGECPICFLPMPLGTDNKSAFMSCCGQTICMGCTILAALSNTAKDGRCLFCRTPGLDKKEYRKRSQERIEANDPAALCFEGTECFKEGDYDKALKYLNKAAELGDAEAHFKLGYMYMEGEGVEKDEGKAIYHYEKAAIDGHPGARHNLACCEEYSHNIERAVKHYIIAAKLGYEASMKILWRHYSLGNIAKEVLDTTLRTHQAAIDATKSPQREKAEEFYRKLENGDYQRY